MVLSVTSNSNNFLIYCILFVYYYYLCYIGDEFLVYLLWSRNCNLEENGSCYISMYYFHLAFHAKEHVGVQCKQSHPPLSKLS